MGRSVSDQAKMLASAAGKAGARKVAVPVEAVVVNGRKLTRDQAMVLERAALLAKGNLQQRGQASAMVRQVERELGAATEAERVGAGIAETVALRGGRAAGLCVEVEAEVCLVRDPDGALARHDGELVVRTETVKRVRRDDGLLNLFKSEALDEDDYATGQLYRVMVARAAPRTRSSLSERKGRGSVGSDDAILMGLEQVFAMLRLRLVRGALNDDRAFAVLDAVAGRGETVRSLGRGGGEARRDVERLVRALRTVRPLLRASDAQLRKGLANQER